MDRFAIPLTLSKNAVSMLLTATLTLGALGPLSTPAAAEDSAKKLYSIGQAAEAKEDYDAAFEAYRKAYAKTPKDLRMRASFYRLRQTASASHVTRGRKLLAGGDESAALAEFLRGSEIDPGNEAAIQELTRLRARQAGPGSQIRSESSVSERSSDGNTETDEASSPAVLKPISNEPLTLHMSEDSKVVYQAIGKAAGINVLFDPDYNGKRIQIDLTNMSLLDALRIVGTISTTFWRPVTENTIFVAQNSRAKRTELDEQAVQTFYLSNAWQQNDLNDVQTALRNVLPNAKVYGVPSQNAIVMRATPDELTLAQKVINDLDKARPEVVVDVAVMEVNKDKLRNIGLQWPGSISFALQPPSSSSTTTTNADGTTSNSSSTALTLNNLANLNATNFAVTVSSATANLLMSDSDTRILQNPRIRSTDSQKASMKIGSRIPIATGSYQTGAATAITSSLVNTQFQFIDVGVQIEMTPTVHFDHDVTLKMKIEVSSQAGSSTISGVTQPIIAQKTSEQTIRLREGEASILSGILNKQDIISASGIPGLGELPLLKYIFGSRSHEVIDNEVVFVLIPHVVRGQDLSPLNLRRIDTGSGQAIELRRVSTAGDAKPAATGTSQPGRPVSQSIPQSRIPGSVGVVKGQTAVAAAPAALAQMRDGLAADVPNLGPQPGMQSGLPPAAVPATQSGPVTLSVMPPSVAPAAGSNFSLSVAMAGGQDVASVPMQIQYDASKMTLINVDSGDLLGKDGQAVALVHRDDGPGMITIAASRPPGTAGVSGNGAVCILSFQAKAAGESDVVITRPGALDSTQKPIAVSAQNAHVVIQ